MSVNTAARPIISVIIPTYNRPDKLPRAVKSVLGQTFRSVEALVVNDCGADVSGILAEIGDARVRLVNQERNQGLAAARNRGLDEARGSYVGYLDDDDILTPAHYEKLLPALHASGKRLAYSGALLVEERLGSDGVWRFEDQAVVMNRPFDSGWLQYQNLFPVHACLHERSLVDQVGGFDPALEAHEDYDLWLRFHTLGDFVHVPETTAWYVKDAAKTNMSDDARRMLFSIAKVYAKNPPHGLPPDRTAWVQNMRSSVLDDLEQRALTAVLEREASSFKDLYDRYAPVPGMARREWRLTAGEKTRPSA